MSSGTKVLSAAELGHFRDHGFVMVEQAFSPAIAREMERRWWAELADDYGIHRERPATWFQPKADLKAAKHDALQAEILNKRVRGIVDDLFDGNAWSPPRDWGRAIVTFPLPGVWDVPTHLWHWDSPCHWHLERLSSLFVVSFIGAVAARSGGTLLLSGSPQLLLKQERQLSAADRSVYARRRELFFDLHPWLSALAGQSPSPDDRIAAFMRKGEVIEGVPLRVVELTGEPGDMVFCHGSIAHCGALNHGVAPRFMRIKQQLLTDEGRRMLSPARP